MVVECFATFVATLVAWISSNFFISFVLCICHEHTKWSKGAPSTIKMLKCHFCCIQWWLYVSQFMHLKGFQVKKYMDASWVLLSLKNCTIPLGKPQDLCCRLDVWGRLMAKKDIYMLNFLVNACLYIHTHTHIYIWLKCLPYWLVCDCIGHLMGRQVSDCSVVYLPH